MYFRKYQKRLDLQTTLTYIQIAGYNTVCDVKYCVYIPVSKNDVILKTCSYVGKIYLQVNFAKRKPITYGDFRVTNAL